MFWPAYSVTVAHTQVFKPHMVEKEQEKRREGEGGEGGKRERGKEGKKEEMI